MIQGTSSRTQEDKPRLIADRNVCSPTILVDWTEGRLENIKVELGITEIKYYYNFITISLFKSYVILFL